MANFPDSISNIPPIVVGDLSTIAVDVSLLNSNINNKKHDWVPVQLIANKNYVIQNLYQNFTVDESNGFGDFTGTVNYVSTIIIDLRDNVGHLIPSRSSQGTKDFSFSVSTSGVYYLDVDYNLLVDGNPNHMETEDSITIKTYQDDYAGNKANASVLSVADNSSLQKNGSIEVNGDHDFFKMPLTANKNYVFNLISLYTTISLV